MVLALLQVSHDHISLVGEVDAKRRVSGFGRLRSIGRPLTRPRGPTSPPGRVGACHIRTLATSICNCPALVGAIKGGGGATKIGAHLSPPNLPLKGEVQGWWV